MKPQSGPDIPRSVGEFMIARPGLWRSRHRQGVDTGFLSVSHGGIRVREQIEMTVKIDESGHGRLARGGTDACKQFVKLGESTLVDTGK